MSLLSLALLGSLIFLVYCVCRHRILRGVSSPPGPKGVPLLGLIRNVPHQYSWLTYADWAKKYGDVFCFKAFGRPVVVLSSIKAATDLFEKRSTIYSGRPRMVRFVASLIFCMVGNFFIGYGRRADGMGMGSPSYDEF